ncbi:mucin-2 [Enhydra lutris kenyoni]|uniref:Mucin-2 n=1 Tax=Enhydra lutris kenyoni TaxID=391180 RepID=A0A2Y9JME9_ENHLU|nr:mucin-2 [Enhydra lutris kenyoni]
MGLPLTLLVAVGLALSSPGAAELQREGRTRNHGHSVCSTWGDFHYKTFDGDLFRFPGLCDYNFASDCRGSYKEFTVHLKRVSGRDGGRPGLEYILLTIKDDTIYLTRQLVVVNGAVVRMPHYSSGLLIEKNDAYTKVYSRAGLTLMWNREDSLMLELDSKFRNHTCGLCGDYNGLQTYSEFLSDGVLFSAIEFGNLQKVHKPEVVCDDPEEGPAPESCSEHRAECEDLLAATAFEDCEGLVPRLPFVQACVQDRCHCPHGRSCVCSTLAEFSRQCAHAGGRPGNWRTAEFCPKSCPGNMVYLESGSPCMDTCSHLESSRLCEEHRMDGCFCPEGTVHDDVAGGGCIPVSRCHCRLHGRLYSPGQQLSSDCKECVCTAGRWVCKDLPCPGTCALEGGSHITTFDGKRYTFHGDCYYVLIKGDHNDSYTLLGELAPCGSTDKQTCLKTVVLLADNGKNVVAFQLDGGVLLNERPVNLPHVTTSLSVFRLSSRHLMVSTAVGLRLQVQLEPVMQLFVTLDRAVQGRVQGLCGNFNGLEWDDFRTAGGLVEATGAGFANTWKAQWSCHDKLDWLDDPCSLNIESANYAEHWCSLLKKTETPFGRCHSAVDPSDYYKRCKYDACNCQNSEGCMCAALSSYARACATKGVLLWGWREQVCNEDVGSCPKSQVFLYNLTTCQPTCRSLSEADAHCPQGFAPVDGCGCPDDTFLDEKGRCVPLAKCSCYHHGLYLEAGEVVLRQEERCVCQNGRLHCRPLAPLSPGCSAPKIYVDCSNLTALTVQGSRPTSCQTRAAGHYRTECVSGCVCPDGLLDDGRGGCVKEDECPCVHNKDLYSPGDKIKVDCNTCTCQRGRWACTESLCHGSCSIYGSGHYVTFDGKYYDFNGHCSYVAAQDYCGQNSSSGSFSIMTENVPCGTTGATCSKAIKIFLGRTELKLEDKHCLVIQRDTGHHVAYTTREVGQYLVVEASIGVIVVWDKKTTIFIKLAPSYKGRVCGLCGNFDQRSSNDFTTRDHMVVDSEMDFGNSWKEAPTCPDVSVTPDPCTQNPRRLSWAKKQCSIIKSPVFSVCHSKVDFKPFYEACVHDSCSCDMGGDCECFCSAVASYAQECTKEGACVFWRTPDLCPIFCDYYNPPDMCEWHYEPCGNRSFETCRTVNGIHSNISVSYLEGCYPRCPEDRPIYDEDLKQCVTADQCGCYVGDTRYPPGAPVPSEEDCWSCVCTNASKVVCQPEEGNTLNYTQDGFFCYWETCGPNGTVERHFNICVSTTSRPPSTTIPVTSSSPLPTTTTPTPTPSLTPRTCCFWSDWINENHPSTQSSSGDRETFDGVCRAPEDIECRLAVEPHLSWEQAGQKAQCNVTFGFVCYNEDQFGNGPFEVCYDYEIRVNCCVPMDECPSSTTMAPTTTPTTTTTTTTSTPTPEPPTTTTTTTTTTLTTTPTPTPTTTPPTTPTTTPTTMPTTSTTSTEPLTTSTSTLTQEVSSSSEPPSTLCVPNCIWTGWVDSGKPNPSRPGGDIESIQGLCNEGWAANISCRAVMFPDTPIEELGQKLVCNTSLGLVCRNEDQEPGGITLPICLNYEINVQCCGLIDNCIPKPPPDSTPILISTMTMTTTTGTLTPTPTTTTTTGTPTTTTPTTTTTGTPTPTPTMTKGTPTTTPIITTTMGTPTSTPTISTTTGTETTTPTPTTTTTTTHHHGHRDHHAHPDHHHDHDSDPDFDPHLQYHHGHRDHNTHPNHHHDHHSDPDFDPHHQHQHGLYTCRASEGSWSARSQRDRCCDHGFRLPAGDLTLWNGPQTSGPTSSKTTLTSETTTRPPSPTPGTPSTPTRTTASTTTTGTPRPPTSSYVPTPTLTPISTPNISVSTGPVRSSTQVGCCVLNETYFAPGEMVYNGTHGDTCYYANCSVSCTIEIFNWSCPSTPSPAPTPSKPTPTSTPKPPTPTASSTVATTKPPGCPDFDPPRQENEKWWLCNCTMAICKYNNTVELVKVECEVPPKPTCANGLQPTLVYSPDECCPHWECDCYCAGWGDPHYVTFDGLYYSYQGNCTYVLVEEVTPTLGNFGVYIDNYHCDVNDQVSCPRTLVVRYQSQEVLIKTLQMGPIKVQVQVNRQVVALPYMKNELHVYQLGINYVVEISKLGALITYNGLSFSITLPHRLFGNNTKGQCGTCTNDTADDCMLPSGEIVSDCGLAADQWVVNDPSKPHCPHTSVTTKRPAVTPPGASTTSRKDCASPLCELIRDSLFAPCHTMVPPKHYYEACVFDSCFVPGSGLECASLQAYAALCAQADICVDWRNHTHGVCSMTCPPHREYRACSPADEPSCESSAAALRPIVQKNDRLVEGCFCPEGTMNYAPGFDVCVEMCGCVGPDNVPRKFGEHFEFDCKDCVCLEGGRGIICEPKECHQEPVTCTEDGTYPLTEVNPADTCCNITSCKCNTSLCQGKPPKCPLGFDVSSETRPGKCCPSYSCVPKGVCVHGNAEYQPGSPVYSSKCEDCVCTNRTDSGTQLNVISCTHVPCDDNCSPGFELVDVPGQCCGKCQQTHCIVKRPGAETIILKPGDIRHDPTNNCTFFSCVNVHNQLISSVSNITCPDFDPSICLPGSIVFMPNGCCRKCIPRNETRIFCSTVPMTKEISHSGCTKKVVMNSCSGSCETSVKYSAEAQALDHQCSCCKEGRTSQREVELSCPDGSSRKHSYTHIESCSCQDTVCGLPRAQHRAPGRQRRASPRGLHPGRD